MQITNDILTSLRAWKDDGDRYIDIRIDRNDNGWIVWAYDYTIAAGILIHDISELDDIDGRIIKVKRQQLLNDLAKLDYEVPSNEAGS